MLHHGLKTTISQSDLMPAAEGLLSVITGIDVQGIFLDGNPANRQREQSPEPTTDYEQEPYHLLAHAPYPGWHRGGGTGVYPRVWLYGDVVDGGPAALSIHEGRPTAPAALPAQR